MPSVLWHCWLGIRKSIWPVNNYSVMKCSLLMWLAIWNEVQMICICASWCQCLPIISCWNKIQTGLTFLALAYPGCSWKEAVKWVSLCLWHNCEWKWTANVKGANVRPCRSQSVVKERTRSSEWLAITAAHSTHHSQLLLAPSAAVLRHPDTNSCDCITSFDNDIPTSYTSLNN